MDKKEIIKYLAIAGGAYLVYWYITKNGPTGDVAAGHPSYWDTWFGTAQATGAPVQTVQTATGTVQGQPGVAQSQPAPVLTQPSAPVQTAPPQATLAQLKSQIMAAASGNPAIQGGYAVPDVWSYYFQQITGRTITPQQFVGALPLAGGGAGAPMTLDQFLQAFTAAGLTSGLSGIVSVPAVPSIPSMSFGGSLKRPNLQGLRGMGGKAQTVN